MRKGIKGGQLKMLSRDDVEGLELEIKKLLETHGVCIRHEEVLGMLDKNGCEVDFKTKVVRFPQYIVEESIAKAPKSITMAGRKKGEDLMVEGKTVYFGNGSGCPAIYDLNTGKRREPRFSDIVDGTKLIDNLPNIDFVMGMASALDRDQSGVGLYEALAMLLNTEKHTSIYSYHGGEETKALIKMGEAVAGGEKELRKRPLISLYAEPVSPMLFGGEYLDAMLEFSKAGLPVIWTPCPMSGGTSPVSVAGTIVQGSAESLAGNVIMQLVNPGTPYIFGFTPLLLDLHKGTAVYSSAENLLMGIGLSQLAHHLRLPFWGTGGISNSMSLDAQAIAESAMSLDMAAYSGQNLIHDIGLMGAGTIASFELVVISDEIIAHLSRMLRGITVDRGTVGLDAIMEAGYGGEFLALSHTREHIGEHIQPELYNRSNWREWLQDGGKTLEESAREKAKKLIRDAEIENPDRLKEELSSIVETAIKGP